ncbi:radical SAM protein [Fusobacterium sp.]|uniref:radical SAM protein n=1 Tax=Fusobacterium sp. TaxID=68766 RepID=UPI0026031399|nr:radical SAM protein [Fusobacterium sp.]
MTENLKLFEKRFKSHHDSNGLINKYVQSEKATGESFEAMLEIKPDDRKKAIYVHTPYCDKICSFCNLNRKQIDGSLDSYAEYVASEFNKYGKTTYFKESTFDVIFFGGGTPTVYKPKQLEIILQSIRDNVKLSDDYEFTFETTLHNLTEEKLEVMMKYGVNRLSVGIQTFSDRGRVFYNRTYGKEEVKSRLKKLKDFFKGDVCVDIIYNFPDQTFEEVIEDARIVKELELSSASFYSLMVHDGSKLSKDIEAERVKLEEDMKKDYLLYSHFVAEMLREDKYHILELTKIAKKGGDNYQYIKVRNTGGDTFPIGVGAGGSVQGIGVYRMSKEMSFYSKQTDVHSKFGKLSGIMQFPIIAKKDIKDVLSDEEYGFFCEKMKEYQDKKLVLETEESFNFTNDGVFWGNNLSIDTIGFILEKIFNK